MEPANTRYAQKDEMPADLYAGIGEIVARWGYLQHQLGVIARAALRIKKDAGRALTTRMDVAQLCESLRAIAGTNNWIKDEGLRRDIRKLASDVVQAAERRNDFAHGVFGYTDTEPRQFVRFLYKAAEHRAKPGFEPMTVESLSGHATQARKLWDRAQAITHRLKRGA